MAKDADVIVMNSRACNELERGFLASSRLVKYPECLSGHSIGEIFQPDE